MPSGLNQILPRMRVTSDALRISALVAVGVTTGYFWRAAFEVSPSTHPVSAPVNIVEPTPKPPVLSTVKPKPVVPIPHIAPRSAVVISSPSGPLIFQTPSPSVRPASPDKPAPRPPVPTSPPPAPSPQPGTPTPPVTTPTPTTRPRRRRLHLRRGPSQAGLHRRRSSRSRPLSRLLPPRATTMGTATTDTRAKAAMATTARTSLGGVMGTRTMIIPGQRATAASRQAPRVENWGWASL